jgi:hypothetical protein
LNSRFVGLPVLCRIPVGQLLIRGQWINPTQTTMATRHSDQCFTRFAISVGDDLGGLVTTARACCVGIYWGARGSVCGGVSTHEGIVSPTNLPRIKGIHPVLFRVHGVHEQK